MPHWGRIIRACTFQGTIERVTYTDDVIDARMAAIEDKFERIYTEIQLVREELRELRREMHGGFAHLQGQVVGLQRQVIWLLGGFVLGLLGLLGAFVAAQF